MPEQVSNKINLEIVNCPSCGSDRFERVRTVAEIVLCLNCELVYLRKRLDSESQYMLYQKYADGVSHMNPPSNPGERASSPLRRDEFLKEILRFIKPQGKLLDIGCGWGAFLENARDTGFETYGIEVTSKTIEFGKNELNLDIRKNINEFRDFEGQLACISLIHTLEHLHSPLETLEKCNDLLNNDGILCGIVPNFASFASEKLQDKWEWLDPYHHIVQFTPESLRKMLEKSGFRILNMYTVSGDFGREALLGIIEEENTNEVDEFISKLEEKGQGEEIRFFAVKKQAGNLYGKSGCKINITNETNIEDVLKKAFIPWVSGRITINDPDALLPAYSLNWNGVTVNRGKKACQSPDKPTEYMNRDVVENTLSGGFSVKEASGKLPVPLPSPLNLNLGCGRDIKQGYVNIDLYNDDPTVVRMDVRKLDLPDECTDLILASDILEHFSHRQVDSILSEWTRVLKPGGKLIIRCPSLKLQARAYLQGNWDADIASYMIFGGQTNPGDYHCIGFDEKSITGHLEDAGLEVYSIQEHDLLQDKGYINLNMTVNAGKPQTEELPEGEVDETYLSVIADELLETEPEQKAKSISAAKSKPVLNILWEGSQFVYHSLALINREHCSNLLDTGSFDMHIVPYEPDEFEAGDNPKYKKLLENDIRHKPEPDVEISNLPYLMVRHQWPPKPDSFEGTKWVIMQPWEISVLTKPIAEIFRRADEIWAPSTFARNSYINSGIEPDKVQVIPNGIDPDLYKPNGKKYSLNTSKRFKFLFVGGTIGRKGIDLLMNAYTGGFTAKDDVCLVVKDMGGDSFYKGQNVGERIKEVAKDPGKPEIIHIEEKLTEQEMASLYRSCDVFVCPYRGEGFSLPTLEAMASGVPVIVTKGGATDDFVDDFCGWKINSRQISIGTSFGGQELIKEGFMLDPDIEELTATMHSVYDNPNDVFSKGIIASSIARTQWTWTRSTLKIISRIDYLYNLETGKNAQKVLVDEQDDAIILGRAESLFNKHEFSKSAALFMQVVQNDKLNDKFIYHAVARIAEIVLLNNNSGIDGYLLKLPEGCPDRIYLEARKKFFEEKYTESLEILTPLLDAWVKHKYSSTLSITLDHLLSFTADLLFKIEDYQGALELYKAAIGLNPQNADALHGAGLCLQKAGSDEDAEELFKAAITVNRE